MERRLRKLAVEVMERDARDAEKREDEMKRIQWIERCKLKLRESKQRKLLEQGSQLLLPLKESLN